MQHIGIEHRREVARARGSEVKIPIDGREFVLTCSPISVPWRTWSGPFMKRRTDMTKRFSEEQIIGFLREADGGLPIRELCRKHGFSEASLPVRGHIVGSAILGEA